MHMVDLGNVLVQYKLSCFHNLLRYINFIILHNWHSSCQLFYLYIIRYVNGKEYFDSIQAVPRVTIAVITNCTLMTA